MPGANIGYPGKEPRCLGIVEGVWKGLSQDHSERPACSPAQGPGAGVRSEIAQQFRSGQNFAARCSTFSAFVVVSSLGTGLSATLGATVVFSFAVVGVASVLAGLFLLRTFPNQTPSGADPGVREEGAEPRDSDSRAGAAVAVLPVLLLGTLGALAFAGENAHQSWSAVFFEDELGTGPGLSSTAPAVFAAVVAITRFSVGAVKATQGRGILILGAVGASLGAAILAAAPTTFVAWIGLAVSAAGTAVLYPTLLGMLSRSTPEQARGRATSLLATVSYLGFLLGPVYVGLWSEAAGLRGAMLAVAGLCAALIALILVLLPICQRLLQEARKRVQSDIPMLDG